MVLDVSMNVNHRDFSALKHYLARDYIQHYSIILSWQAGLRSLVEASPKGTFCEHGMIVAEGDGCYTGATPRPLVAVHIFRFEDGLVREHWDVLQEEVPASKISASNPMFEPSA